MSRGAVPASERPVEVDSPTAAGSASGARRSIPRRPWSPRSGRIDLIIASAILILVVIMSFAPGWFTGVDPNQAIPAERLLPPSPDHPFGTDAIGRDQFARVVHGSELSLLAAVIAVAIALSAGGLLGLAAGTMGGKADAVVMRLCDAVIALPGLLAAFAVAAVFGPGSLKAAIALGASLTPSVARVMRSEVLRVKNATYVEAARACGMSRRAVVFQHILPNSMRPVLVLAALEFGQVLLIIGALSYLGLGEPPPTAEWGRLIATGQPYLAVAWWLSTIPGLVLLAVVISASRIAHALGGKR